MRFYFPPVHLVTFKEKYVKDVQRYRRYRGKHAIDPDFKEMLFQLVSLPEDEVAYFTNKQSPVHMVMLASYMPFNDFHLDLSNVVRALNTRYQPKYLDAAYLSFHYSLGNTTSYKWMYGKVVRDKKQKILNHVDAGAFIEIMHYLQPIDGLFDYAKKHSLTLSQLLQVFHIGQKTILKKEIEKRYYMYADRAQYIKMSGQELNHVTGNFASDEHAILLNNYLEVMDQEQYHVDFLEKTQHLYNGPYESNQTFWSYVSNENKRKFRNWMNYHNVHRIFGNDERTIFWKKYLHIVEQVHINEHKERIALEIAPYVIVEFKQSGNATYVYKKDFFEDHLLQYFRKYNTSPHDNLKHKKHAVLRLSHMGAWQWHFSDELRGLGIKP